MTERDPWPSSESLAFVEGLYEDFVADPASVPETWRELFEGWAAQRGSDSPRIGPSFRAPGLFRTGVAAPVVSRPIESGPVETGNGAPVGHGAGPSTPSHVVRTHAPASDVAAAQDRLDQYIRAFRVRGHMLATIDPLGLPRPAQPELEPGFYGFTDADMGRTFSVETLTGAQHLPLAGVIERLRNTYCRSIGVQFMHIDDLFIKRWLQERMEGTENRLQLSREEQLRILTRLTDAVVFEEFIQKKYLGAKSFSLEGCESLIPLLHLAIDKAGEDGIAEIVLGMAHRGRLNVLANILGKRPRDIFREFEDADPELHFGRGDVKYHLGHSHDWRTTTGRKLHLSLCFNPSHLEFVGPVALGRMRAKQDRVGDVERRRGLVLLIHGDAAFAGEGVVQETLNLSELGAYTVGGAVHVIVNNQIGFTTDPREARSSTYATDVAKMLQSPIFHVNGEDPEAVAQVVRLAMDFRNEFRRDVIIDMYGYRRRGHNEGDEPSFTQPVMYKAIEARPSVREGYLEHLSHMGGISRGEAEEIERKRREELEQDLEAAKSRRYVPPEEMAKGIWQGYRGGEVRRADRVATGIPEGRLAELLVRTAQYPEGFQIHPKLARILDGRKAMAAGERRLDWSAGEALALSTLATEGYRVRLAGQDAIRGTFSHRHSVFFDSRDGSRYEPLQNLAADQAPVEVINSPLSEAGVLGFEYGYSLDSPECLTIWEAQFGDFCNAGQVAIDQFIVSAEEKWNRLSSLVLLLPHGFEGMGPEHSSARLERFLMLAVEDNIQVANPTTPAQLFHLLRRQMLRRWRKPLVVMSPKSLLRNPRATSTLEELAEGEFLGVLPDEDPGRDGKVERVLLCSGKIYYELAAARAELDRAGVAILRLEELYPLSNETLGAALAPYKDGTPVLWVQEEPRNMGAWSHLFGRFGESLFGRLPFSGVSREASASPATGSPTSHRLEQRELIEKAFGGS